MDPMDEETHPPPLPSPNPSSPPIKLPLPSSSPSSSPPPSPLELPEPSPQPFQSTRDHSPLSDSLAFSTPSPSSSPNPFPSSSPFSSSYSASSITRRGRGGGGGGRGREEDGESPSPLPPCSSSVPERGRGGGGGGGGEGFIGKKRYEEWERVERWGDLFCVDDLLPALADQGFCTLDVIIGSLDSGDIEEIFPKLGDRKRITLALKKSRSRLSAPASSFSSSSSSSSSQRHSKEKEKGRTREREREKERQGKKARKSVGNPMDSFRGTQEEEPQGGDIDDLGSMSSMNAKELLWWCNRCLRDYPGVQVTNFTNDWVTGVSLCCLLHFVDSKVINIQAIEKDFQGKDGARRAKKNLKMGLEAAAKLGVHGLRMEDILPPNEEEIFSFAVMLYSKSRFLGSVKIPDPDLSSFEEDQLAIERSFRDKIKSLEEEMKKKSYSSESDSSGVSEDERRRRLRANRNLGRGGGGRKTITKGGAEQRGGRRMSKRLSRRGERKKEGKEREDEVGGEVVQEEEVGGGEEGRGEEGGEEGGEEEGGLAILGGAGKKILRESGVAPFVDSGDRLKVEGELYLQISKTFTPYIERSSSPLSDLMSYSSLLARLTNTGNIWVKRWAVLKRGAILLYYEQPREGYRLDRAGWVALDEIVSVVSVKEVSNQDHVFVLVGVSHDSPDNHYVWAFQTKSEKERSLWISNIREAKYRWEHTASHPLTESIPHQGKVFCLFKRTKTLLLTTWDPCVVVVYGGAVSLFKKDNYGAGESCSLSSAIVSLVARKVGIVANICKIIFRGGGVLHLRAKQVGICEDLVSLLQEYTNEKKKTDKTEYLAVTNL